MFASNDSSAFSAELRPDSVKAQFKKTRMCAFFQQGHCEHGMECRFAHSRSELLSTPNLMKTKLCFQFFRQSCNDRDCKFAHGYHELRGTACVAKTQLCRGWQESRSCRFGYTCRYAHGEEELRDFGAKPLPPDPETLPLPNGFLKKFVDEKVATDKFDTLASLYYYGDPLKIGIGDTIDRDNVPTLGVFVKPSTSQLPTVGMTIPNVGQVLMTSLHF